MDAFGVETDIVNKDNRINTGIDGLDNIISGGFPEGSVILVSGTPGTGKTIVCFQYINAGIQNDDKCLYLTSDEPVNGLINEAIKFGYDFQTAIDNGQLKFINLDLDSQNLHKEIEEEIKKGEYDRIILDSLTPLSEMPVWMVNNGKEVVPTTNSMTTMSYPIDSIQATRLHLRRLMNVLKKDKSTVMVTSEIPEGSRDLSRDSISEFLADGIVLLGLDTTMDRRKITVRKMRKTKHTLKPQDMIINETGITLI